MIVAEERNAAVLVWRGQAMATTINPGKGEDFTVHAGVYEKVQARFTQTPNIQERRKRSLLSCLSCAV
jgi:hypothetical protein